MLLAHVDISYYKHNTNLSITSPIVNTEDADLLEGRVFIQYMFV